MNATTRRGAHAACLVALAAALALAGGAARARAATITIINQDGAGEGFNDPTPAAPVGGNNGATIGQQRLNVFREAARVWSDMLPSSVEIRVEAVFDALTPCDATSGVLGRAGPKTVVSDFPNAAFSHTWYHVALGNKLAGSDLDPGDNDIVARFNSSVDDPTCLGSVSWYYGFDHQHGTDIDLLPVVIHELGHGLGYSTFADLSSGQFFNNQADLFSRFMLDDSNGLHWNQMSDAQRASSTINTGNVVWDGAATTAHAPDYLLAAPRVQVNTPAAIAGIKAATVADFSAHLGTPGVTADVVLADDGAAPGSDACSALVNGAALTGKIALIDRGTCTFVAKAQAAEAAGAAAAIIVNNVAGAPMGMSGTPVLTIPVVGISLADGNAIKGQLGSGVNMTIGAAGGLEGTDGAGRVLLYMPNPVEPGSSVSHWDVSATPDLLMEPFINPGLTSDVDLTRYVFEDLGWDPGGTTSVGGGGVPAVVIDLSQPQPNPFPTSTSFSFTLDRASAIQLDILDLGGRRVRRLFDGQMAPGPHPESWDGTDDHGRRMPAGVYLYRVKGEGASKARRMVYVP